MAKSRKAKTAAKKAAKNARIEAAFGSKSATKKVLKEELGLTDREAERAIDKARAGGKVFNEAIKKRAKQKGLPSQERAKSYQKSQRKRAENAKRTNEKRVENLAKSRLDELRETDPESYKNRASFIEQYKPSKVFKDGVTQLGKKEYGDWVTLIGYSEDYHKGDRVVTYQVKVNFANEKIGQRFGHAKMKNMSIDEREEYLKDLFGEITQGNGKLVAFRFSKDRTKD